jgi:hypothetical protein
MVFVRIDEFLKFSVALSLLNVKCDFSLVRREDRRTRTQRLATSISPQSSRRRGRKLRRGNFKYLPFFCFESFIMLSRNNFCLFFVLNPLRMLRRSKFCFFIVLNYFLMLSRGNFCLVIVSKTFLEISNDNCTRKFKK